ncbi:MAG: hypothetical protein WDN45_02965 [Caulobacteraceae bacterium]
MNTMGDRGIMMLGGTLSLHGDRKNAWTKLSATAKAGAAKIQVLNAAGWRKGRRDRPGLHRLRFETDGGADHRRHRRRQRSPSTSP